MAVRAIDFRNPMKELLSPGSVTPTPFDREYTATIMKYNLFEEIKSLFETCLKSTYVRKEVD